MGSASLLAGLLASSGSFVHVRLPVERLCPPPLGERLLLQPAGVQAEAEGHVTQLTRRQRHGWHSRPASY